MLQVAMANRRCTHHKRTIGHRFGNGLIDLGVGEGLSRTDRGTSVAKGNFIGIDHSQVRKTEIAHGPCRSTNIQRIADVHQDHV